MERVQGLPRAILHVDGDAFFAACEVARNPGLRGQPVVTGRERGIVSAATYEAKKLGIHRAMPIFQVKKQFPQVTILAGDYDLYGMYAKRLYAIVGRYARRVEEYGIDECFGDLTGQDEALGMPLTDIARRVKEDLSTELALSFSVGLAGTKALAKLGSKWGKPNGLTVILPDDAWQYLAGTAIKDVWGIGRALSVQLEAHNINSALDFVERPGAWIEGKFAQPTFELWKELRGEAVWKLAHGVPAAPHSIQRTRTFTPPSADAAFLWSHLSGNVEEACMRARADGLIPARASFFIKSQEFRYRGDDIRLAYPSDAPTDVLKALRPAFLKAYERGVRYRATGVTLFAFRGEHDLQLDMWGGGEQSRQTSKIFASLDRLAEKYGESVVSLGSSFMAAQRAAGRHIPGEDAYRERFRIPGTGRKHLPLPVLGSVS